MAPPLYLHTKVTKTLGKMSDPVRNAMRNEWVFFKLEINRWVLSSGLWSVFVVTKWSPFLFLMSLSSYLTLSDTAAKQNVNYIITFSFLETYRNAPPPYFVRCPNIVMHSLDYVDLSAEKRYFKHQQVSFGLWQIKIVFLKNLQWNAGWWSRWCFLRCDHWPTSRRSIGWRSVVIRPFWREKESTEHTWNRFRTKDPSMPLLLVYGNFIVTAQRCQTQSESEWGECDVASIFWSADVIWCGFVLVMSSKQLDSVPFPRTCIADSKRLGQDVTLRFFNLR